LQYWERISQASQDRIFSRYTWEIYAKRLVTQSQIYTFWRSITPLERRETKRYLEALYILLMRRLVEKVPETGKDEAVPEEEAMIGFGVQ
jgi:sucrose synthase